MDKRAEFNAALKEAMKSKEEVRLSTVRLILAALKDRDITARSQGKGDGISDDEILQMLASMIKQRRESSKAYQEAGREELSEREEQEIQIIQSFMPKQLTEAETEEVVEKLIQETGAESVKDIGKVMGKLKEQYAGKVDMGIASGLIKDRLA